MDLPRHQFDLLSGLQDQKPMQQLPEASAARFVCGLVAGMVAKLATHPLDVAKKRFQV